MIKQIIILLSLLLMASCSSLPEKHYYQLSSDFAGNQTTQSANRKNVIYLESVNVAAYLNKSGIVYQTGEVEYRTANHNLWLTPLQDQIEQRVLQDLSLLLPDYIVTNKLIAPRAFNVQLFIDAFHGYYQGEALIKGYWLIENEQHQFITKSFDYTQRQSEDGYQALVKELSKAWQEEIIDFAKSLK